MGVPFGREAEAIAIREGELGLAELATVWATKDIHTVTRVTVSGSFTGIKW